MRSLVTWAVKNSPAVNTMLAGVLLIGAISLFSLRREFFPQFELEIVLVTVPYPGASPEEVEEGICQKVEEAVRSLEGIKKLASIAQEGAGYVILELETWIDVEKTLNRVRSEVDRIPSFPELAEDPEVEQITFREPVIRIGVIGPTQTSETAELRLREVAEKVRTDVLGLPTVTLAEIAGSRPFQIDVEISEDRLREYGLTLSRVAEILRRENVELPGGSIRADTQEVILRGKDKRLTGAEIANLPLITRENGLVLRVSDLGEVRDAFEDITAVNRVNGKSALTISVDRAKTEDLLQIVDEVKQYIQTAELPPGYQLTTWGDQSIEVRDRLDLLIRNGTQGLILVFIVLALFLELKLAFWVAMGMPISLLGTAIILLYTGQTLNMLSMFAFLMALGIVVDDAIVIGENIFMRRQQGQSGAAAAIEGTMEVLPSVTSSVLTTIVAFMPLLFVSGVMGKFIAVMPIAVIAMLTISLIESAVSLPCHLAHLKLGLPDRSRTWGQRVWAFWQGYPRGVTYSLGIVTSAIAECGWRMSYPLLVMPAMFHWLSVHVDQGLNHVIEKYYMPLLSRSLRNPLGPICVGIAVVVASLGLVKAGVTPWDAFPKVDSNEISASITYPDGTPSALTAATAEMIEHSILDLNQEWEQRGEPIVRTTRLAVGEVRDPSQLGPEGRATGSHVARVDVELVPAESRHISSQEIIAMWRERTGAVAGVESITFGEAAIGPGGTPIEFRLLGDKQHMDEIEAAVERCKEKLATYRGVVDIRDDSRQGKWEFQIRVNDKAKGLGVSLLQIAQTVRAAYFGEEAMRLQRGRHEVKLMVRYPEEERRKVESFDDIYVRALDGTEYPLSELAEVTVKRGYSEINRIDQKRSIAVIADVTPGAGNAADTVNDLKATFMPGLLEQYRNVEVLWEGQQQQTSDSISSLGRGLLIALVAMFVLLTIEFKSYAQPFMIMLILPFGLVGALWGHAAMGLPLTLFSVFGLVALTGVVVNDSIVLVDAINHRVSDGLTVREAILDGCKRRFRPVLLTSVTTIAGLTPMLFETSFQAQFLIPLAVTIVFGLGCTTLVVLGMVPLQYQVYGRLFLRHLPQDDDELVLQGEARQEMAESQSAAGNGTNGSAGNGTTAARPVSNTSTEPIET